MKATEMRITIRHYMRRSLAVVLAAATLFVATAHGQIVFPPPPPKATDIALTGGFGWQTIPLAFSKKDGHFDVVNQPVPGGFATLASDPNAVKLAGDFDGDGRTDIALTGPGWWNTIPVAFTRGSIAENNLHFDVTNQYVGEFAFLASDTRMSKLVGDFNRDGRSDIALLGAGSNTIPIAESNGNGSFVIHNEPIDNFGLWAADSRATKLVADFDGDFRTDIALCGSPDWNSVPVAYSLGGGRFTVRNEQMPEFAAWAANPRAQKLVGDFNRNFSADILLTGPPEWNTAPTAYSVNCMFQPPWPTCQWGTFGVLNPFVGNFAAWSATPGAIRLVGDFDGDYRSDVLLTGPGNWRSLPIAFARDDYTFAVTNQGVGTFAQWASDPRSTKLVGDFNADGKSDLALIGPGEWQSIPVAFSNGNGSFYITNFSVDGGFAGLAAGATRLKGNFDQQ